MNWTEQDEKNLGTLICLCNFWQEGKIQSLLPHKAAEIRDWLKEKFPQSKRTPAAIEFCEPKKVKSIDSHGNITFYEQDSEEAVDKPDIGSKIISALEKFEIYYEDVNIGEEEVMISILWGDWKHEHAYCDYVMSQLGYKLTDEKITEENGGDCYSSKHFYSKIN